MRYLNKQMKVFAKGEIVTYGYNAQSSNTFIIDTLEKEGTALLSHPLSDVFLMRVPLNKLDLYSPQIKDSQERGLDFVKSNLQFISVEKEHDVEALCLQFIHLRYLTKTQKQTLSLFLFAGLNSTVP